MPLVDIIDDICEDVRNMPNNLFLELMEGKTYLSDYLRKPHKFTTHDFVAKYPTSLKDKKIKGKNCEYDIVDGYVIMDFISKIYIYYVEQYIDLFMMYRKQYVYNFMHYPIYAIIRIQIIHNLSPRCLMKYIYDTTYCPFQRLFSFDDVNKTITICRAE